VVVGAAKRSNRLGAGKAVGCQMVCLLETDQGALCASAEYAVGVNVKELLKGDNVWVPVTKS
jgi:hypothetical protein